MESHDMYTLAVAVRYLYKTLNDEGIIVLMGDTDSILVDKEPSKKARELATALGLKLNILNKDGTSQ